MTHREEVNKNKDFVLNNYGGILVLLKKPLRSNLIGYSKYRIVGKKYNAFSYHIIKDINRLLNRIYNNRKNIKSILEDNINYIEKETNLSIDIVDKYSSIEYLLDMLKITLTDEKYDNINKISKFYQNILSMNNLDKYFEEKVGNFIIKSYADILNDFYNIINIIIQYAKESEEMLKEKNKENSLKDFKF